MTEARGQGITYGKRDEQAFWAPMCQSLKQRQSVQMLLCPHLMKCLKGLGHKRFIEVVVQPYVLRVNLLRAKAREQPMQQPYIKPQPLRTLQTLQHWDPCVGLDPTYCWASEDASEAIHLRGKDIRRLYGL